MPFMTLWFVFYLYYNISATILIYLSISRRRRLCFHLRREDVLGHSESLEIEVGKIICVCAWEPIFDIFLENGWINFKILKAIWCNSILEQSFMFQQKSIFKIIKQFESISLGILRLVFSKTRVGHCFVINCWNIVLTILMNFVSRRYKFN